MHEDNQQAPQIQPEAENYKQKADDYLNNWKRAVADLANFKKEEVSRAGLLIGYAKESMFSNLLPVIDSIYLAAAHFGEEGFAQVQKQIEDFLKKEGIEEIAVEGKEFDPNTMESIGESENGAMELVQKGYKIGEKVLRPVKVKVAK